MKMRMVILAVAAWACFLLLGASLRAQSSPPRVANASAKPGELIVITAPTEGKVGWFVDPRDFPPAQIWKSDKVLVLTTMRPGTYPVGVILWKEQDIQTILVTVDGPAPPPVPDPPSPDPPQPPADQLVKDLQAALGKEAPEDRAKLPALIAACRDTARDAAQAGNVLWIRNAWVKRVLGTIAPTLPHVRGVIVRRLDKALPTADAPLTDSMRDAIRREFEALAEALAEALGRVKT